jgi:imidazole glycerol-phosphate synthase subunit HisH
MEVTLIDSPYSNAANIARALRHVGADLHVTRDPDVIAAACKLVLPGVGTFGAALAWLRDMRIDTAITTAVSRGAAILGICVGHQLLFDASHEMGTFRGLALIAGEVVRYGGVLPVPQVGWNRVKYRDAAAPLLFEGVEDGTPFYFVNSYAAVDAPNEVARGDYDGAFTAAVARGRVFGVQFHPEKSSIGGLRVLQNYVEKVA